MKLFFVTLDVYAKDQETISKLRMMSQAEIILSGFYMRTVLVHISPSNALFR